MSTKTAGRIASPPQAKACPEWCVIEHGDDPIDDIFHRSEHAQIGVPAGQVCLSSKDLKLTASICLPEVPEPGDEGGFLIVDLGDLWGPYAELDAEHADQFIRDLKTFTARVQQFRDQLATKKEQQS